MMYVNEFEFFESDGYITAVPFGMEGGTFGDDLKDAVECAADWLTETVNTALMKGEDPGTGSVGNAPLHGGTVIAVAVDCDLSRVDAVTAAEAARMLGVSSARVAQMCEAGKLESWKDGSRRMVARASVEARMADAPSAGRPRKKTAINVAAVL